MSELEEQMIAQIRDLRQRLDRLERMEPEYQYLHDPVTVQDSDTIDLTLTGQQLQADARLGNINPTSLTSGAATNGQVPLANGSGGIQWGPLAPPAWTPISASFTAWPTLWTNLITNPSIEVDTSGWTAFGSGTTIAKNSQGYTSSFALLVTLPYGGSSYYAYTTPGMSQGTQYDISFYILPVSGDTNLSVLCNGTTQTFALTGGWQYCTMTVNGQSSGNMIKWYLGAAGQIKLDQVSCIQHVDGGTIYADPNMTSQCVWTGTANASTSKLLSPLVTCSDDLPDDLVPGSKLRLDTGYYYLLARWVDSLRNMTVLMPYGGSDYAVSSVSPASYSNTQVIPGFPEWFNWTPTFTGFSTNPSGMHRFRIDGKMATITIVEPSTGISNAATLTISLPASGALISNGGWLAPSTYVNSAAFSSSWGRGYIAPGASSIVFGVNASADGGFATSAGKRIPFFQIQYEYL